MHALAAYYLENSKAGASDSLLAEVEDGLVLEFGPMHRAARAFLMRWMNLSSRLSGPGVQTGVEPFHVDPRLCVGEFSRFQVASKDAQRDLYPLGEYLGGLGFLAIDSGGAVWGLWPRLVNLGQGQEALECLLMGYEFPSPSVPEAR